MTDLTQDFPQTPRRLRIARTSAAMAWLSLGAALVLPAGLLAYWSMVPVEELASAGRLPLAWLEGFGPAQRLLATLASLPSVLLLSWGLLRLRQCFLGFAGGGLFAPASIRGFRDFAMALAGTALLSVPSRAAVGVVLSWGAPSGQRQLALSISSDMLLMLCLAGAMAVVGWVLAEAADIAEEHASFV